MSFLNRLRGSQKNSASAAKERLQLVLIHDRADISPGKLNALKDDLIAVLSQHIPIDASGVNIHLTQDRNEQRLVADIPLSPLKSRRR